MFEDNKYKETDLMMRSILEDGVEEVPAGVWEAVSEGLDKASRKKTVVLMWKRAAVGFGVAAALATGLVLNHGGNESMIPQQDDMIAVVESDPMDNPSSEDDAFATDVMMAEVRNVKRQAPIMVKVVDEKSAASDNPNVPEVGESLTENEPEDIQVVQDEPVAKAGNDDLTYKFKEEYEPSEWVEEKERDKVGASLVFSGIAGTNGTQARPGGAGMLRQPSISSAPPKTGVKETSTRSIYGIPLSFGAGVKVDLNEKWSLGAGFNYTLLTRRFYGSYTKVNEQGSIEMNIQTDIRNTQNYVGVPVNLFYNIVDSRHLNFYTYAGGSVEKCVSDKYQLIGKDITHTEKVRGLQLSANLGIGVEFLLGDYIGLYIDPSLRYYFDNGQPASIRTAQPLMLGFEMGMRVRL